MGRELDDDVEEGNRLVQIGEFFCCEARREKGDSENMRGE